jgi:hypothetical protein
MESEIKMTEFESLQLITSMINKAKNGFRESGTMYLLWGWLIFCCCILQFIAMEFFQYNLYFIWFSTWILLIYQIFFLRKKRKTRKVRTYTEEINGFVWLVFFICLMLLVFVGVQFEQYEMIDPMILVLYGMPTFLSGVILKFRPLMIGAVCCWVLAIVSPFVNTHIQLLLLAAGIAAAWIIPGYLLKKRFKNENE